MNFTEREVIQYEILAEALNNFDYFSEDVENRFLMFILNIESLLPFSNTFQYVFKNDTYKNELEEIDREMWRLKNRLSDIHNEIDREMWRLKNRLSDIHNDIDDSEWKVETNSTEEIVFNCIKQKLIIEKKLNYGSI